jgi:hypothetical protein
MEQGNDAFRIASPAFRVVLLMFVYDFLFEDFPIYPEPPLKAVVVQIFCILLSPIIFAPPTNDIPTCFIYFPGPCRPMPLGFASAQLSECLQRCLTPQSVPPGLALPAAPPGLPAPLARPAAALGPLTPLLPPMPEVDMGVESSPETAEMPARLGAEWFPSVSDASDGSLRFEPFFGGVEHGCGLNEHVGASRCIKQDEGTKQDA